MNDLTNEIISGISRIVYRRRKRYGGPVVLKGEEGELLRRLLVILAGDKLTDVEPYGFEGTVYFHNSVILDDIDCSTELNKWRMVG
jgi:hypothetical protein